MELISYSPSETQKIARKIINDYLDLIKKQGLVILLDGELGSGKTIFTQGLGTALKIKRKINSPTFIIFKKYTNEEGITLFHIDCYRLKNSVELKKMKIDNFLNKPFHLIVIEWPSIFKNYKKKIKNLIEIKFTHISPLKRKIEIKKKLR
jgi:tRNA threonylcarbamoyladenosine biosynthesis protein TsaE